MDAIDCGKSAKSACISFAQKIGVTEQIPLGEAGGDLAYCWRIR
jgi:hypothetical protein